MRLAIGSGVVVGLSFGVACYPGFNDFSNTNTVTTLQAPQTDYTSFSTYSIVDSILELGSTSAVLSSADSTAIITGIRSNLNARGYTEVDPSVTPPDLVALAIVSTSQKVVVDNIDWWGSWGWWPSWGAVYGPGWGWSYPPPTVVYTYDIGTVFITVVNRAAPDVGAQKIPVIWAAILNGALNFVTSVPTAITNGIDQAFDQSPYFHN